MATVTIDKSYFDAMLRRAEFHTSGYGFGTTPPSPHNVTISKVDYHQLLQAMREYNLLKNALFRGGLSTETLDTLLSGESGYTNDETSAYATQSNTWEESYAQPQPVSVTMTRPHAMKRPHVDEASPDTDKTAVGSGFQLREHSPPHGRVCSYAQPNSPTKSAEKDKDFNDFPRALTPDQHTIIITNLAERTTHKDLVSVIRGGKLLDVFLRNDRSATVTFVDGAAEFLAYTKRNDIYLNTKRLEFRWSDRQFQVSSHVYNKIANGATRNLVVRGAAGKLTADQIRDHLDHIHKLVVVDINFRQGDAYISTNSVPNALFARTCMMSRTAYKSLRVEWYPDECATSLPQPPLKVQNPAPKTAMKPVPIANRYMPLDTGSDQDSGSEQGSYLKHGISVSNRWTDAVVA